MKPLRLILPITLFILSGVLAWVGGQTTNIFLSSWCTGICIVFGMSIIPSLVWALGGFDD